MFLQALSADAAKGAVNSVIDYLAVDFVPNILQGNLLAIVIAAIVLIFVLLVFFETAVILFSFVKRFFLAIIVFASLLLFVNNFQGKIFSPEPDLFIVSIGIIGAIVGMAALIISFFGLFRQFKAVRIKEEITDYDVLASKKPEATRQEQLKQPRIYTIESAIKEMPPLHEQLQTDKSLLAVLSYIIIAEFGIFSTPTLAAPTVSVGIAFVAVFMIGAIIFIRTSYHDYARGVRHLLAASFFGLTLSVLLGHFWGNIPMEQLLSLGYFTTNSLVAFVTGIAVSLLMGTKG